MEQTATLYLLTKNILSSLSSTLGDPDKEKHEQARLRAKANLQRLRKIQNGDGTANGEAQDGEGGQRNGPAVEELQLNEYENMIAMDVVAPEDINVGFDGTFA